LFSERIGKRKKTSNRTIVELKLDEVVNAEEIEYSSNRTIVELKRINASLFGLLNNLLIAPSWN